MNSVFDSLNHPIDTMHRVRCVLALIDELLCSLSPEAGLALTPEGASGLAFVCQDLRLALGQASEMLENPQPH